MAEENFEQKTFARVAGGGDRILELPNQSPSIYHWATSVGPLRLVHIRGERVSWSCVSVHSIK
jgi:hypothetical protein